MKRFKLSIQLSILFLTIFTICAILFSSLSFSTLGDFSVNSTYKRLTTIIESTKNVWDNPDLDYSIDLTEADAAYIRIIREEDKERYTGSSNINSIVSTFEQNEIINSFLHIPNASGTASKNTNKGTIYYSYAISETGNGVVIITNSNYTDSIKVKMTSTISYIFLMVLLIAFIALFIWSKSYTTRLFRLKTHVKNLPNNNYEGIYIDDGKDEISELSNTIEEMRQELLKTEFAKREMLQNLSHDFKTPISVIKSYGEAIKDGVEDINGIDVIINQCELLQSKVSKLILYNKLEYLSHDKEFEEVNISGIITDVVATYKHKNINFELNLDDSKFIGYSENFYTVIDNIIDNATRYAKTIIKITLKNDKLTIYNDGEPIDEKFLNGFKAYEKGSKGQFGLGMSIVKKTLDFFGYELNVKNEEIGVIFTINRAPNKNINVL